VADLMPEIFDVLGLPFMQRALLAALLVGLTAPSVGIYLVQRRLALMGDGIGHVALVGVAAGVLLGTAPVVTAVVVSAAGAIAIEAIRARGRTSGDIALAILFYGGIAGGVLLLSLAPSGGGPAGLMSYLFGSVTTLSDGDLAMIGVLSLVVLSITIGLSPRLFALCQDEEFARVAGLPVRALNTVLAVTAAVTVTVAMRAVGVLLISALMVVPVATAQLLARGFRTTLAISLALGAGHALAGVVLSYQADLPSGPSIVVLAIAGFAVVSVASGIAGRVRRRGLPTPAPAEDDVQVEQLGGAPGTKTPGRYARLGSGPSGKGLLRRQP
jgi:zinc transport system permease protein